MENKVCNDSSCQVTDREISLAASISSDAVHTSAVELFLFGKSSCPLCKEQKEIFEKLKGEQSGMDFTYFDLDTVDGLSKAAYYNAFELPVTIIMKDSSEFKRWETEVAQYETLSQDIENIA